ncbi:nuclear transport factor 2 family protein [Flagellimonas aequoris]|uniref:Nuclear transport factor 2 family protein n=1 Tax=Flagellimonas aequoris TaxID=2306997 RepID=A0A418N8T6_9FLAO|nr:nuclear transport factor 2 family protein [Allomuricauda aequoris]RIV71561.1 hypothetical protein D2U88_07285 [Allomuricauda aequoris]TXK03125.1 nuclear transport factor 2 family protein [Allomuricauda aequoris]
MKIKITLIVILLFSLAIKAQDRKLDSTAITSSIHTYIENFFENNFEAMNSSLHPRLAKRGFNPDGSLSEDFPPGKLKELMATKPKFELRHQQNTIDILGVFGNMASARLRTGYPNQRWTEYIHLLKEDGQWKIINVFWEFSPKNN